MNAAATTLLAGPFGTLLMDDARRRGETLSPTDVMTLLHSDAAVGADVARRYAEAGADMVYLPTLCADTLSPSLGSLQKMVDFNTAAVREVKNEVGDIPVSSMLTFIADGRRRERGDALTEQAEVLIDSGIDTHTLETLTDTDSARAATEALLEAGVKCGVELKIHLSFVPTGDPLTLPELQQMLQYSPQSVGINCFYPPEEAPRLADELIRTLPGTPVAVRAATSFPGRRTFSPEETADIFREIIVAPSAPSFIGVCCGGDPQYIKCLKNLLTSIIP